MEDAYRYPLQPIKLLIQATANMPLTNSFEPSLPASTAPPAARSRKIILGVLFVMGMLFAWLAQQIVSSTISRSVSREAPAADRLDITIPRSSYSAEEVVRMQMESLRAAITDRDNLIVCYSLASPINRRATGPFDRFVSLVSREPYDELALCKDYQVGTAVSEGDSAAVLVSLLTQDDLSAAFRFVLVKQQHEPYQDCWMTEGVFAITPEEVAADSSNTEATPLD